MNFVDQKYLKGVKKLAIFLEALKIISPYPGGGGELFQIYTPDFHIMHARRSRGRQQKLDRILTGFCCKQIEVQGGVPINMGII